MGVLVSYVGHIGSILLICVRLLGVPEFPDLQLQALRGARLGPLEALRGSLVAMVRGSTNV